MVVAYYSIYYSKVQNTTVSINFITVNISAFFHVVVLQQTKCKLLSICQKQNS